MVVAASSLFGWCSYRKMERHWVWLSKPQLHFVMVSDGFTHEQIEFYIERCIKKIVHGDLAFHYPMVCQ